MDDLGGVFLDQLGALETDGAGGHQQYDDSRESDDENAEDLAVRNWIGVHAIYSIAQK